MNKFNDVLAGGVVLVLAVCLLGALLGLPVMLLWNALCPELFGLPKLGFFQAIGLNILAGLLFRSSISSKQ